MVVRVVRWETRPLIHFRPSPLEITQLGQRRLVESSGTGKVARSVACIDAVSGLTMVVEPTPEDGPDLRPSGLAAR